jgi:hypothetical protein
MHYSSRGRNKAKSRQTDSNSNLTDKVDVQTEQGSKQQASVM